MDDASQGEMTEFVRFWNEVLEPKFSRFRHVLVDGLGNHSAAVFPKMDVREGDRILDAASGFGDTACLLAECVGPTGSVHGIDCCEGFVTYARDEADARGLDNVDFEVGDIQGRDFGGAYDMVFSRFGTMFFDNPVMGMKAMASALGPGGRLAIIVWRDRNDNPAFDAAKHLILKHLPPPGEDADTCGPGPFSQANPETLKGQLKAAGFTDIALERVDAEIVMGKDEDDAIAFQLALGPAGEIYREAGELATQKHDAIAEDLRAMYAPYKRSDGIVMGSSSWLATAVRA